MHAMQRVRLTALLLVGLVAAHAAEQPQREAWTLERATNCYQGRGGAALPLDAKKGEPWDLASVDRCKAKCLTHDGCQAVTVRERPGERAIPGEVGKPVSCWLRAIVDLGQCERRNAKRKASRIFDTYPRTSMFNFSVAGVVQDILQRGKRLDAAVMANKQG